MASRDNEKAYGAQQYNKTASFVYSEAFTTPVLELLAAKPGERIIDFGCGSGELPIQLAKVVGESGEVVGVDASASMIEQAKKNGVPAELAFVCDVQDLRFPEEWKSTRNGFDAVFTNAALHWCKRNPAGVVRSAMNVLRSGGRFVGEMGGFTNCIGVRSALHHALRKRGYSPVQLDPWYFPSDAEYRKLLEGQGFRVDHISLHARLTPLNGSVYDWMQLFCRNSFLESMPDQEAEEIMREVEDVLRIDCCDAEGKWAMMYTRLRFVAVKA